MNNRQLKEPIQARVPPVETREEPKRDVPTYQRCPICYGNYGGIGVSRGLYRKSSTLHRRYYKCDQCVYSWTVDLTPEQVRTLPDEVSQSRATEVKSAEETRNHE
jgi:hypothetical protein